MLPPTRMACSLSVYLCTRYGYATVSAPVVLGLLSQSQRCGIKFSSGSSAVHPPIGISDLPFSALPAPAFAIARSRPASSVQRHACVPRAARSRGGGLFVYGLPAACSMHAQLATGHWLLATGSCSLPQMTHGSPPAPCISCPLPPTALAEAGLHVGISESSPPRAPRAPDPAPPSR